MLCLKCKKGKTVVEDSRLLVYTDHFNKFISGTTRRKRVCLVCYHSFRTVEIEQGEQYLPKELPPKPGSRLASTRKKQIKISGLNTKDVDELTDEELEEAIYNGTLNFEEG